MLLVLRCFRKSSLLKTVLEPRECIPPCTFAEILRIVCRMTKGKAGDPSGNIAEMFLHGEDAMISYLVYFFNLVIETGEIPSSWKKSCFVLLHKGGTTEDPNNWRPIAILSIIYKIFGKLILSRIKPILDSKQADEQFGFQDKKSTSDALIIMESMVSRCIDGNIDLWVISVDLRKAFDRVEYGPLFDGLKKHGLSNSYVQILREIYSGQTGMVNDSISFPINRGVRQGDILSPILFNSAL